MTHDIAVIGAGVAGMSAALILAKRGYAVALVEAAPRVAPVLRGFKRKGVGYDTGFHYAGGLKVSETLEAYFCYLGLSGRLELAPPLDGMVDVFRAEDFACDFPYGYAPLRETLTRRFPAEAAGLERYLDAVRSLFEASPHCNPGGATGAAGAAGRFSERTLAEVLNAWLADPKLKTLLGMHALLYGADPRSISFNDHARFVGSYYQSAHRLLGGGRSLAKAYEAALAAAKVTVMTKRRLTGILSKETGAGAAAHELTGLQFADGERLNCRTAVSTVHPQLVAALAPASTFRQVYRQRLAAAEDSFSAYAVFAATTRPIPLLEQGNLHVGQHPSFHLDRPADSPLEQRPLFLAQSIFSQVGAPDRAHFQPSGVAILCPASLSEVEPWLATRVGRRPAAYRSRKADVGRRILAKALAVYPELEGGLAEAAYATPLTFRDYSHSPQGSLYGMRRGVDALAPLPVTRLKGLYLAGQAVTGPGVLGAIISAFIACGAVFGNDDLLEEVGRCRRRAS